MHSGKNEPYRKFLWLTIFILLLTWTWAAAQPAEGWRGHWIGPDETSQPPNTWICYRKQYTVSQPVHKALSRIACDSKYWLWVNGRLVVYEGQLKRGPNPNDTYYDTVDLLPYIQKGTNTIAVLHWYFGKDGFSHKSSGKAAILFDACLDDSFLVSDKTWKTIVHPAFGQTGDPHPNYRLPGDNIYFDARKDITGWQQANYNDDGWSDAVEYGMPPAAPWNDLILRPIPLWRVYDIEPYENIADFPKISTGKPIVAKLPKNITISPYLKITSPAGLKIDIRTDNYKGGSEYNYRSEYVTKNGVQEFESLAYLNGHEVIYTIPEGVEIISLGYRQTRYDTDFLGRFECDDPSLNLLWQKSRNTMNINMRDCIQDPDRERAQWWGDACIVLGEIFYSCDTKAHALIKKAICNLADWQKPDGVLYSPIPAGNWDNELPCQMLGSIGEYGFWYYYRYTADSKTIAHVYPAVRKYLSLWQIGENGLVVHRSGGWDWGDWGDNKDRPVMDNAWYYMALKAAVEMAELTGNQQDVAKYRRQMKLIKENFNRCFWTGQEYRSKEYTGLTDDRGHGLAVVAGLTEESQWPAIQKVLRQQFHSSPYTEKYILESLFLMDNAVDGLNRMKSRYEKMIASDVTTLWEGWGIGPEGFGGGSYNHGWAGGPLTLLCQYVAGVSPEKPGFAKFNVLPQMGHLRHVRAIVPTVKGQIEIELDKKEDQFIFHINCPPDTSAVIGIPADKEYQTISVNDKCIWPKKKTQAPCSGVQFIEKDDRYYKCAVQPGTWTIIAKVKPSLSKN